LDCWVGLSPTWQHPKKHHENTLITAT